MTKFKLSFVAIISIVLISINTNAFTHYSTMNFWFGDFVHDCDKVKQDRSQKEFEYMMSELQRVHKGLYSLPFSYDYIKENLVPQVETKKKEIAPHFPNRSDYGNDAEKGNQLFKEWFLTYPNEWKVYVAFLDQLILENSSNTK